jgi:hypothetical protein
VGAVAVRVVALQRYPSQEVLLVDGVVIYSPDRGVVLATHIQALAVQEVVQEVTAHTTATIPVALLMGRAVAAVGVRVVAATV